jgi:hypothetical protein
MNAEIGKLLGQLKKYRLKLFVDEKNALRMKREPGTNEELPAEFLAGMSKHKTELTAVLTGGTPTREEAKREWPERCRLCKWLAFEAIMPEGCPGELRCPYRRK